LEKNMVSGTLEQAVAPGPNIADEPLYEIVNGERVEIPHMGALAGTLASFLVGWLNQFAAPKKLGFAVSEVMFNFGPGRQQRRPDVAFIRWERWKAPTDIRDDPQAWEVVPSLAIEVVSPSNSATEIEGRVLEYFDAGVELVWVIHPRHQRIYVHESPTQTRVLGATDELDGANVLPGFRLKIADLFAALQPQTRSTT
jgi:Uma2 family endonuclease